MNADAKKAVLRMIPYGIYVLTVDDGQGNIAASTVNWVTQTAFAPPLLVVGVKADSGTMAALKVARKFALNMLGKSHKGLAFAFFKPPVVGEGTLSGQPFHRGASGAPLLTGMPGALECQVVELIERGDHHVVIAEVIEAHQPQPFAGRPDTAILEMKDLGDTVFYGG